MQALDYVIAEAKKYGIYLILSLVNNWNNYGGKQQYVTWAAQQSGCNDDKEEDDNATPNPDTFYTNPTIQTWFKNYMKVYCRTSNLFFFSSRDARQSCGLILLQDSVASLFLFHDGVSWMELGNHVQFIVIIIVFEIWVFADNDVEGQHSDGRGLQEWACHICMGADEWTRVFFRSLR